MENEFDSGLSVNFTASPKRKRSVKIDLSSIRVAAKTGHDVIQTPAGNKVKNSSKGSVSTTLSAKEKKEVSSHREKLDTTNPPAHGIISSLFRANPDIPKVQKKKVTQIKEKLFSSDDFHSVELHPFMISNLEKLGFSKMTAVQQETIPKLLNGQDVLVKSQTGSGKTMAYAIPIIEYLAAIQPKVKRQDGILAVVLVPTRELAVQSFEVFQKLLKPFIWVVPGCLMGGEQRKAEKARLRKGVNILIATPGRMIDHMQNTANMELQNVRWLVLDEADRLLDMGFEAQVSRIVTSIENTTRQTVLLSATLTEDVERLAGISLKNPQKVSINENSANNNKIVKKEIKTEVVSDNRSTDELTKSSSASTSDTVALPQSLKQLFVIVPCKLRLVCLLSLILSKCKKNNKTKIIVFLSTQDSVEFMYRLVHYLSIDHQSSDLEDEEISEPETSLNVFRLHGDMSQKDRTSTFQNFCSTKSGALLCTDVAARGLHLPSVQWVVHYVCPAGSKDYVHRAGRTARAGTSGTSLLFLLPSEVKFVEHLASQKISLMEMKLKGILSDIMKLIPTLPGAEDSEREVPRNQEEAATYLQFCCENFVKRNKEMEGLAKKAFQSCVRAYATYPSQLKSIFHVKHLHLGHMAKTFGLRDAPSNITGVPGLQDKQKTGKRKFHWDFDEHDRKDTPQKKMKEVSEFDGSPVFSSISKLPKKMKKKLSKGKKVKRKK